MGLHDPNAMLICNTTLGHHVEGFFVRIGVGSLEGTHHMGNIHVPQITKNVLSCIKVVIGENLRSLVHSEDLMMIVKSWHKPCILADGR